MRNLFVFLFLICFIYPSFAQQDSIKKNLPSFLINYNKEKNKIAKTSMTVLGSWAVGNIVIGTIGAATTNGSVQYFHINNIVWNVVNLGLALPSLVIKEKKDSLLASTLKSQGVVEKIFIANACVDVAYITAGVWLLDRSAYSGADRNTADQLKGFGESLILQGAFLLLFDTTMTVIHSQHRKKKLDPMLNQLIFTGNGIQYKF